MQLTEKQLDLLNKNKFFIAKLKEVEDTFYESLVAELGITPNQEHWLFDYIFNCNEDISLDEYLEKFNQNMQKFNV